MSTKLSQLLCVVIFDKSYGLFSHLSAVEAIFGYENCRKSGSLAEELSYIGHWSSNFKVKKTSKKFEISCFFVYEAIAAVMLGHL